MSDKDMIIELLGIADLEGAVFFFFPPVPIEILLAWG